ncbi:DUF58 domain-containing protein [Sphingomonas sp. MMS24-JH45]
MRARLSALRLHARRARGTGGIGLHASRDRGAGLEFRAGCRPYEPGDKPRQIDWKLYARSDRFFVREAERESPVALWILIDGSASISAALGVGAGDRGVPGRAGAGERRPLRLGGDGRGGAGTGDPGGGGAAARSAAA